MDNSTTSKKSSIMQQQATGRNNSLMSRVNNGKTLCGLIECKTLCGSIPKSKSCQFTHYSPVCIAKARNNLNNLQERLKQWYHVAISEKELKYNNISKMLNKTKRFSVFEKKLENIHSGTPLTIYQEEEEDDVPGVPGVPDVREVVPVPRGRRSTVKKLECNDNKQESKTFAITTRNVEIVQAVMHLLQRFESDRDRVGNVLEKECARTRKLDKEVNVGAYERIHKLPKKVQEMHDGFACDLQELRWHFNYQSKLETKLLMEKEKAEILNKRLVGDITVITESEPFMEEKLCMEGKAIQVLAQKQSEIDGKQSIATKEMAVSKETFEQAKLAADGEQRCLIETLSRLSDDLNVTYNFYVSAQNDREQMKREMISLQQIMDNDGEEISLREKNFEEILQSGLVLKETIKDYKESIVEQSDKQKTLDSENEGLQANIKEQEKEFFEIRKTLEYKLKVNTQILKKTILLNKKTKKEISIFKKRIDQCEKNRLSNEKSAKRAVSDLQTVKEDLNVIKEQALDLRHHQVTLQIQLDQEVLKAADDEKNMTEQIEMLQKENKEESHDRHMLLAQVKGEILSFDERKAETECRRNRVIQTDEHLQTVLGDLTEQLKMLSVKRDERCKAVEGLDKLLASVDGKSSYLSEKMNRELKLLGSGKSTLNDNLCECKSKQEYMDKMRNEMNHKLLDMESSTEMMTKVKNSSKKAVDELQIEMTELQVQVESACCLQEKLRITLLEAQERSALQQSKHSDLINHRQKTVNYLTEMLCKALHGNNELATKHVNLQNKHINTKNEFIRSYEENVIAEEGLRDKESLCNLHTRLHEALKCYYQLRGIQTKAGLSRFEDITKAVHIRLGNIQLELEKCIHHIFLFLKANRTAQRVPRNISRPQRIQGHLVPLNSGFMSVFS